MTKIDLILKDFIDNTTTSNLKDSYLSLYNEDYNENYIKVFSFFHQNLNELFEYINHKKIVNNHFNAEPSRELIWLLANLENLTSELKQYGEILSICEYYKRIIKTVEIFLSWSGGSAIPDDFEKIKIIKYEPIFHLETKKIRINNWSNAVDLIPIWQGSYSLVSKFKDPTYDILFAIKKLRKNSSQRDVLRFQKEFNVLKSISFPYILDVYKFNQDDNSYTMEYCDDTLNNYIIRENKNINFDTRKRIILQFLYAINYLHSKNILHRDISYGNILIKKFDWAIMVKLSDFWLLKNSEESNFTKTETEIKGTILDPSLSSFKDYTIINEIFSVGFIIYFIFTWKKNYSSTSKPICKIINKCINSDLSKRYTSIWEIIKEIELLNKL